MQVVMVQASDDSAIGYKGFGAAAELWRYKGPEVMLSGPYETGKTIACLNKLHALMVKYPGARALMVRKTYQSLVHSAVVTYEDKVLPYPPGHELCAVHRYGGEMPQWYDYPNGSRIVLGGLDKSGKVLSAEYDFIYVNQAEELTLAEWETLTGRATGRAGNAPYPQVMGDCNPDTPYHWIVNRPSLKLLESRHRDNPTLFNQKTGEITEQGTRTMTALNNLTGVRKKRGKDGLWVAAEGQVYDFDPAVHVINPFAIPGDWNRIRVIDFGYRNPFVCLWLAEDDDGRLYLYREIYMTGRTVKVHSEQIKALSANEHYLATVTDHDAEDRATLAENGIKTIGAKKDLTVGIEKVQERLKVQADGKPRLFVFRGALIEEDATLKADYKPTSTEKEFAGYVYPQTKSARADDERPVKMSDHGMDALRYGVMYFDGPRLEQPQAPTLSSGPQRSHRATPQRSSGPIRGSR